MVAAIVTFLMSSLVIAAGKNSLPFLFIFLFFIGFMAEPVMGGLGSLFSESSRQDFNGHILAVVISSLWLWNGVSAHRRYRLMRVMPDVAKIYRAEALYLPLFEGITNSAKSFVKLNLFACPKQRLELPRGDRYLNGTYEVLFSTRLPLSQTSSLQMTHVSLKGEIYKYRKGKFKGSRGLERFTAVLSGLNGQKPNVLIERLKTSPNAKAFLSEGFDCKTTNDKIKVSLSIKRKSSNHEDLPSRAMLPGEAIQALVAALSDIHSKTL
jgi:hypothetical protein